MTAERVGQIEALLQTALQPTELIVEDDSAAHRGHAGAASGAGHFNVTIVAEAFRDKSPIQRHRMVHAAVRDMMPDDIHALSIKARLPESID